MTGREKERTDMACLAYLGKIMSLFAIPPGPFQQNLSRARAKYINIMLQWPVCFNKISPEPGQSGTENLKEERQFSTFSLMTGFVSSYAYDGKLLLRHCPQGTTILHLSVRGWKHHISPPFSPLHPIFLATHKHTSRFATPILKRANETVAREKNWRDGRVPTF